MPGTVRAGRHTKMNTTWSLTCRTGNQIGEETHPMSFQNCTVSDRHAECSGSTKKEPLTQPRGMVPVGRPSGLAVNAKNELG